MVFDEFLREVAPLFGLQRRPFQRKGIKRKVERRIIEVGLSHYNEYLLKVQEDLEERNYLSKILTVTISRFFRDQEVFDILENSTLPSMVEHKGVGDLRLWSIGCASGEEPYSLLMLWKEKFEKKWLQINLSVLATDIHEYLLKRAKEGRYKKSSLKEVPEGILRSFFKIENEFYTLNRSIREGVEFKKHDIVHEEAFSGMDIVFCRNLAFTYFSKECQIDVLKKIYPSLNGKGYLIIGKDELLPLTYPTLFIPVSPKEKIYQKFNLK